MSDQFSSMASCLHREIAAMETVFVGYSFTTGCLGARMISGEQKGPMWGSIFVTTQDGVSIGRLLYVDYGTGPDFSHRKAYGEHKGIPLHDFWFRFESLRTTGKDLDMDEIRRQAEVLRQLDLQAKIQWRLDHPKPVRYQKVTLEDGRVRNHRVGSHRKALEGKSLDCFIAKIIQGA